MTDSTAGTGTTNADAGTANADGQATGEAWQQGADGTQQTEQKPGEQPGGDTNKEGEGAAKVPESYEFKMPEGVELDSAAADEFSAIAKDAGLTQEQAQKVADVAASMVQRQAQAHADMVNGWAEQAKADKEFGGDQFDANLGKAKAFLDKFASPAFKALLVQTGIGNHPEMIRFAVKGHAAISEDGFAANGRQGGATDPAKRLFPNMN